MKIRAEVLSVETAGDVLRVTLQGSAVRDAEWRQMLSVEVDLPMSDATARAYFVGRLVTIDVNTREESRPAPRKRPGAKRRGGRRGR